LHPLVVSILARTFLLSDKHVGGNRFGVGYTTATCILLDVTQQLPVIYVVR